MMDFSRINTIGIFRALPLGDLLCSIPAIRGLRSAAPYAKITLIGLPGERPFAQRFNHYFDDFLPFSGWPGLPELPIDPKQIAAFLENVRTKNFDLLIQMHGDEAIFNNMCMLWNAKKVAGLRKKNGYCPDEKLFPELNEGEHEIQKFLYLLESLDIQPLGERLEFPFTDEDMEDYLEVTKHFNLPPQQYVCIHPGGQHDDQRWPIENFAAVGNALARDGYTIVLTGSDAEIPLLEELERRMEFPVINPVAILDELSLGALGLIIKNASLLISNNTGASHISAALEVPSVVIFSPDSEFSRWAPLNRALHRAVPPEMAQHPDFIVKLAHDHLHLAKNKEGSSSLLFN